MPIIIIEPFAPGNIVASPIILKYAAITDIDSAENKVVKKENMTLILTLKIKILTLLVFFVNIYYMPVYIFKHPEKEEYVEILQSMEEDHSFTDENGLEWKRVFTNPQLSCSASLDPFDGNAFVEKTGNMKGTYGDMMDLSKEMSEKRKDANGGVDPIKESYYKKYSKERKGAKHPDQLKQGFENKNVKITYD